RACVLAMSGKLAADRSRFGDTSAARAEAIAAALVDESPEGRLLHRYEMSHDRALRATIKELAALAKSGADLEGRQVETKAVTPESVAETGSPEVAAAPTEANPPAAAEH